MIKTLSFLPLLFITSTVLAGTSTFECTGYTQDKRTGQISKITLNSETAVADSLVGGTLYLLNSKVDLLSDKLVYQDEQMRTNVTVDVKSKTLITDLVSISGKRENYVRTSVVKIDAETDGAKASYDGVCTETIVVTCNGACDQF